MPDWVDRTIRAANLEQVSDTEVYAYVVNDMPRPFKDRDVIIHTTIEQNPVSFMVAIRGTDDKDYLPPKLDYVRMRMVKSHWSFTPLEDGSAVVVFQG